MRNEYNVLLMQNSDRIVCTAFGCILLLLLLFSIIKCFYENRHDMWFCGSVACDFNLIRLRAATHEIAFGEATTIEINTDASVLSNKQHCPILL